MIDQIAADLLGRIEHQIDRDRTERRGAHIARRHQRQLQHSRLGQFGLLALQLQPGAIVERLALQAGDDPRAQQGGVERLEQEILGALFDAGRDRIDLVQR